MKHLVPSKPPRIGEIIFHGIMFDPKNGKVSGEMGMDELVASVSDLFASLERQSVDYLLVGGIAMLLYVQGRNTQDIDLIVNKEVIDHIPELVPDDVGSDFMRCRYCDVQVDLLLADNALFDLVRRDFATYGRFAERKIRSATVEGLLLLKLFALPSLYRQGEFDRVALYESDIRMLLQNYAVDVGSLQQVLLRHLSADDCREVGQIVTEIQDRVAMEKRRFGRGEP